MMAGIIRYDVMILVLAGGFGDSGAPGVKASTLLGGGLSGRQFGME
jgi:hypothetical protein